MMMSVSPLVLELITKSRSPTTTASAISGVATETRVIGFCVVIGYARPGGRRRLGRRRLDDRSRCRRRRHHGNHALLGYGCRTSRDRLGSRREDFQARRRSKLREHVRRFRALGLDRIRIAVAMEHELNGPLAL